MPPQILNTEAGSPAMTTLGAASAWPGTRPSVLAQSYTQEFARKAKQQFSA
jgi:hypothetical protein